jgi:SdrD B-like protein
VIAACSTPVPTPGAVDATSSAYPAASATLAATASAPAPLATPTLAAATPTPSPSPLAAAPTATAAATSAGTPAPVATTAAATPAPTPAGSAVIQGLVRWWNDPAPGIVLRLVRNGMKIANATTDASGRYRFGGLAAGTYLVAMETPFPADFKGGGTWPGSSAVADGATVEWGVIQVAKTLTIHAPTADAEVTLPLTVTWSDEFGKSVTYTVVVFEGSSSQVFRQETTATQVTISSGMSAGKRYTLSISGVAPAQAGGTVTIAGNGLFFTVRN